MATNNDGHVDAATPQPAVGDAEQMVRDGYLRMAVQRQSGLVGVVVSLAPSIREQRSFIGKPVVEGADLVIWRRAPERVHFMVRRVRAGARVWLTLGGLLAAELTLKLEIAKLPYAVGWKPPA